MRFSFVYSAEYIFILYKTYPAIHNSAFRIIVKQQGSRTQSVRGFLFEVFHSSLEHLNVILTGNILIKTVADSFAVSHLTEYTAVRRGDTLDSTDRAVGVEVDVCGSLAVKVYILCSDLSVFSQLLDKLSGGEELTFTVRDGNIYDVTHIHSAQPGRFNGSDSCVNDSALVTADVIEGKGGTAFICIDNLAVGYET